MISNDYELELIKKATGMQNGVAIPHGKTDAVVIGGGIVGTATAFWLSRAGLDVVLVEMRDGLSTLTTPASAECFRAQFAEPAMAELAIPSIEMFERFDASHRPLSSSPLSLLTHPPA